jgi:hypothetical protein
MLTGAMHHHYAAFATELKFVVDKDLAGQIREWVRAELSADPYAADAAGDGYQTTTLYFDTADLDLYFRRRSYARAKFRVRRYNNSPTIFLERKMKVDGRLSKRRSDATLADLDRLAGAKLSDEWAGRWFARRLSHRQLRPVCQIAYDRTARVGMADTGPMRLTLDVNLRATTISTPYFTEASMHPVASDKAVLEMKYRVTVPPLFERLIDEFSLTSRPFSKYRSAMRTLGLVEEAEESKLEKESV